MSDEPFKMDVSIHDLGGSLRRVRVSHPESGDEVTRDFDFLREDGREALKDVLLAMMHRHDVGGAAQETDPE